MAKAAPWRDELWKFYERVLGKNYRNYIYRFSNKESEVQVSFHVKGDEMVVIASPSSLRVIRNEKLSTDHSEEVHKSAFSKKDLKAITPLIREAELR